MEWVRPWHPVEQRADGAMRENAGLKADVERLSAQLREAWTSEQYLPDGKGTVTERDKGQGQGTGTRDRDKGQGQGQK
jgi:hypothetical protein